MEEKVIIQRWARLVGTPSRLIIYALFQLTFFKYLLNMHLEEKLGAAEGKEEKECNLWIDQNLNIWEVPMSPIFIANKRKQLKQINL